MRLMPELVVEFMARITHTIMADLRRCWQQQQQQQQQQQYGLDPRAAYHCLVVMMLTPRET